MWDSNSSLLRERLRVVTSLLIVGLHLKDGVHFSLSYLFHCGFFFLSLSNV